MYLFITFFILLPVNFELKIVRMKNGRLQQWLRILVSMLILLRSEGLFVNITYLPSAVAKGAGKIYNS